jgi:hypothetical protein
MFYKQLCLIVFLSLQLLIVSQEATESCDVSCHCIRNLTPAGVMISHVHPKNEWMLSYRYMQMGMGTPIQGRSAISEMKRPMEGADLNLGLKADIESRLMNRNYELNNNKGRTNKDYETNNGVNPNLCGMKETMAFENSRFTAPVFNYREMYTADYAFTPYLFVNPQDVTVMNDRFMNPNRYGESSRYINKQDKYDIKPKQFATLSQAVDYNELVKGLLPTKTTNQVAAPPYI